MLNIFTAHIYTTLKKILHYSFKVLKIGFLLLLLFFIAAYIYVSANKKKIITQVTQQISDKLKGDVKIENADISFFKSFPRIAVYVENILITDTVYSTHKHAFFKAKELFINLNIIKLIKKEAALSGIRVKQGSIFLYTDSAGYTNTYLLETKKDPQGGPKKTDEAISIKNILLQQMRFTLLDNKKNKFHDFVIDELKVSLDDDGNNLLMKTKGDILVKSLAFNLPNGIFLKEATFSGNFKLQYGKITQLLSFNEINVKLSGHPYTLSGSFDLGDKNPGFTLKVKTQKVLYNDVRKLLPKRIDSSLSIASVSSPINAEAELHGPLRGGEPYIKAMWDVKDASLKTNFMDFEKANFTGYYKNEVTPGMARKDPNSVIKINDFNASWHGLKITSGTIEILNLQKPTLTCDLHSVFPLQDLNELLQTESLKLTAGTADVLLSYKGPVEHNNNSNSFLNGKLNFKNGKILYAPRNVLMTDVNGSLIIKNSNVIIENINCKVFNNQIVMNGIANNLLSLISTEPNKVQIDYNIYSPVLNLAPFKFLLQSRNQSVSKGKNEFGKLASQVDELLAKSRINVDLKADRLLYNKLNGSNLNASISILQDRYLLNKVSMNLAEGSMRMNGKLINLQNGRHQADINADMQHVNVQKIFSAFDNFGQDGVTDKNLEGKLTASANVKIDINSDGKVLPGTSMGLVDFSLKKGALNNFEPLKKIQNIIFKKRDFENIQFAELKNKLNINRGEITINRMEIQSSVFTFFVEGLFSQRGNTDISVQVPLNNLKKRGEDYKPENIGVDKKGGRSIFLRGQPGSDGNIQFKLDLLKKYQKEKENGSNK